MRHWLPALPAACKWDDASERAGAIGFPAYWPSLAAVYPYRPWRDLHGGPAVCAVGAPPGGRTYPPHGSEAGAFLLLP